MSCICQVKYIHNLKIQVYFDGTIHRVWSGLWMDTIQVVAGRCPDRLLRSGFLLREKVGVQNQFFDLGLQGFQLPAGINGQGQAV